VGSNPTSPIKRIWLRHEGNRPHYHCVYRIYSRIFFTPRFRPTGFLSWQRVVRNGGPDSAEAVLRF